MTVQEMDISLNISAHPNDKNENDFILNLMKTQRSHVDENKITSKKTSKPDTFTQASNPKKRVKQKFLSKIVAQRLKDSKDSSNPQSVQSKLQNKTQSVELKFKKSKQEVADKDTETNKSSSNVASNVSNELTISFAKVTKENFGKIIVAKKRNIRDTDSKRTLSSVFSKGKESGNTEVSLLNTLKNVDTGEDDVPTKTFKLKEFKKSSMMKDINSNIKKKKKHIEKSGQAHVNEEDSKGSYVPHKSVGKIASLFGNNPDIPNIGQRFVRPISEPVFAAKKFTDLNVHPFMISNLEQTMQITKMTIVQQKAIPQIFSGKDVLIRSQTGSGKTLAYALPIVECLHKTRPKLNRNSGLKALVVVPTRELALQTYECFLKLTKPFTWIVPGYLAGGEKRKAEKARLRKGCNILVSTPGRLLDHIKRTEVLKLENVKYFVLDEADRMFDMGYEKDISGIVSSLKISNSNENTRYDAMQMLRHNVKKVFTDNDSEGLENSTSSKKDVEKGSISNKSISVESDDESNNDTVQQKQVYHSSSDDDSDADEPFVKSKKSDKKKGKVDEGKECSSQKDSTKPEKQNDNTDSSRRQTILLSATLTQSVEKLAGLAMEHPVFVDAAKENLQISGGEMKDFNEDLVVPQSVMQSYVVTPPKLRMVTLSAYIAGKCQNHGQHKVLIFMATQDMVDYHTEILSSVLTKPMDEEDEDSDPLVDVEFFKLHGSMTQKDRTDVFKTFRQAKSGVLLCTDVAARGLDMPKVDCVIQYTGPTSARDYVHRIGRTARAGSSGSATIFLIPSEIEFVRMLESRRIRIKQENMDDVLDKLLTPLSKHNSAHAAAIALQNEFETLVLENVKLRSKACNAYTSWVRFYSSYPRDMREMFNRKDVHLGHFAKSFALRQTPQRIGGMGKKLGERNEAKQQHNNRLTNERPDGEPAKKHKRQDDRPNMGSLKRVRMLNTSEYGSGLEPVKKPKKH